MKINWNTALTITLILVLLVLAAATIYTTWFK